MAFLTSDIDGDGVPTLLDAAPRNPLCSDRAGLLTDQDSDGRPQCLDPNDTNPSITSFGDPNLDVFALPDEITTAILQYSDSVAIGDAALAQNRDLDLYPADPLIDAAEAAGIDAATIARWRSEFGGN